MNTNYVINEETKENEVVFPKYLVETIDCGDDNDIENAYELANKNPQKALQALKRMKINNCIEMCEFSPQCVKTTKYLEDVEKRMQTPVSCTSKTYFDDKFGNKFIYYRDDPDTYLEELENERERCCPKYFGIRKISKTCRKLKNEINATRAISKRNNYPILYYEKAPPTPMLQRFKNWWYRRTRRGGKRRINRRKRKT